MYDISVFAERLIAERKKKKLTQSELAEKAKISAQTVSYYEKGTKRPTLENAIAIANALCVSIEYLCGGEVGASPASAPIATVADLVNRIFEMLPFNCYIIPETYEEEIQVDGDDYPEWVKETIEAISIRFSERDQPKLVEFFKKRKRILDLLNDNVLDRTFYDSWVDGEMQKLSKISIPIGLPF